MEELLALKWNNHSSAFLTALSALRHTNKYSDATIACGDKFYKVHKVVLSTCSDYFGSIFDEVSEGDIIIVLKDISCQHLESLLDYMYMGETNICEKELASLIKAATSLKVKGFLTSLNDDKKVNYRQTNKRLSNNSGPSSKKRKTAENRDSVSNRPDFSEGDPQCNSENSNIPSVGTKLELKEEESSIKNTPEVNDCSDDSLRMDENEMCLLENLEPEMSLTADDDTNEDPQSYIAPTPQLGVGGEPSPNLNFSLEKTIKHLQNMCKVCGKTFGKRYDLDRHTRVHTGEKPFQCLYCLFRGRQKSHVVNHILSVHQDIAGSSTVTTSDLGASEPIRRQDGSLETQPVDPSRICGYCGKVFRDKNRCMKHTLIHTSGIPHPCFQCSYTTNKREDLLLHISTTH